MSTKGKLLITLGVTIGVLAMTYFLFPTSEPLYVPPNDGDEWIQIDQPDSDPQPEPEPEPEHDSSDDHGCEGLEHGKGKKVGLHERCDD